MKYTKIPEDTFERLQLNAGILVDSFTPATGVIGNLLGATTGGISFSSNPRWTDFGEDIDNCPANMMELKKLDGYDPAMSGTFLTVSPAAIKALAASADIDTSDSSHVIPRNDLLTTDFDNVWWLGDYSNINNDEEAIDEEGTDGSAGFLAIHLMNALNTAGIQIASAKNEKGQMAFDYHAHYSMDAQDTVPFEVYCKAGTAPTAGT